jgi:D-lyxose ketol-isomerase
MKRSQINRIIKESMAFFMQYQFELPEFAFFSIDDWKKHESLAAEIFETGMGWDVTDSGMGDFKKYGLTLFTLRNGIVNHQKYQKPYAEKIMISRENQVTPMHFHKHKMEDIINRGGGVLAMQLYLSAELGGFSDKHFTLSVDGIQRTFEPGEWLLLKPGQSVTLLPDVYHTFHAREKDVMIGEVSMVNDDNHDNFFYEEVKRFPDIEEDEQAEFLLVGDYAKFLSL